MRLVLLFVLLSPAAIAQGLSFGLKAGAPATDAVKAESWGYGSYHPASGRYTIGPIVELHLGARLSVEFDALYRPVKYRVTRGGFAPEDGDSGSAWQFPLLLKYRLSGGLVAPYIAGGVAFNHLSGFEKLRELTKASSDGLVAGAGLEGHLPIVRLAAEIRYTRWRTANLQSMPGGYGLSNLNQLEALVGFAF